MLLLNQLVALSLRGQLKVLVRMLHSGHLACLPEKCVLFSEF